MGYSEQQTALTVSVPLIALVGLVPSGGIASAESVVLGDSSGQLIRDVLNRMSPSMETTIESFSPVAAILS